MTKIKSTKTLSEQILAPMIKYCADNKGKGMPEIREKFNQGLAEPVSNTCIHRWLQANRAKAGEPSAGALLRLQEVWREIRGVDVVNKPEPSIYCGTNGHTPNHGGTACKSCGVAL